VISFLKKQGDFMQLQPDYIYKKEIYDFDGTYLLDKHLTIQRDYNFLHYHNVFEIGMVVEGNGTFLINNQIKYFSKGDISVMYPGDFHITNSVGTDNSIWDYILVDITSLIAENPSMFDELGIVLEPKKMCSNVFSEDRYPIIHQYVRQLFSLLSEKPALFEISLRGLFTLLLTEIYRNTEDNEDRLMGQKNINTIIPAITYISRHYNEEITAEKLSEICSLSQTHLRRNFKNLLGFSPFEYIYRLRITAAKSLLKSTQMPITRIAQEIGYESQTSFNNHFKQFTGITPSEYRKKNL